MHDAIAGGSPAARGTPHVRFDTLDMLRGVAAFCIVFWHFTPLPGKQVWSAYLAVDLFFVMSGVVIAHTYEQALRRGWRPWRFLLVRIIRLWPLYILGSAIRAISVFFSILDQGWEPWRFKPLVGDVLRATVLLPPFHWDGTAFPLNRNAWSLFCEFLVNIAYGFGGYRLSTHALVGTAAISAAVIAWGAFHFANWDSALNLGGLMVHLGVGTARAAFAFPIGVLITARGGTKRCRRSRCHAKRPRGCSSCCCS